MYIHSSLVDLINMARSSDLGEKDIPFLLEQLQFQSKSLAEAEQTIAKLQKAEKGHGRAMTVDEKDEADLEIETLQDRYLCFASCQSFELNVLLVLCSLG